MQSSSNKHQFFFQRMRLVDYNFTYRSCSDFLGDLCVLKSSCTVSELSTDVVKACYLTVNMLALL
jgi:hypothetical protein